MRGQRFSWLAFLLSACLPLSLSPCLLHAHPVPKDNHDRTVLVRLLPEGVVVDYTLEVDEGWAARELPEDKAVGLSSLSGFYSAYARHMGPELAGRLSVKLDGKPLPLTCETTRYEVLDHVRCEYRFRAPWKLQPDSQHTFSFRDGAYSDDYVSAIRLSLNVSWQLTATEVDAPPEELINRLPEQRSYKEYDRLREVKVTFVVTPSVQPGEVRAGLPPDPEPSRPGPRRRQLRSIAEVKDPPGEAVVAVLRTRGPAEEEQTKADHSPHGLLHLLLDTHQGVGVLLVLAALFGAAHALTPGHGKTLVAAYLVGERGTVWHALVLGVATTVSHTWAVILAAAVLTLLPWAAGVVESLLGLVGGLIVAGLGFWLLLRRLGGQADHVHLFEGHGHSHAHGHSHGHSHAHSHSQGGDDGARPGWWGVILLGLAGGIVPCFDAVLLLGFAISAHRLSLAVPLLLAFSAGLAAVLVLLGVGVVHARNFAVARWGMTVWMERLGRVLPLVSAGVITALGLWLCFSSLAGR